MLITSATVLFAKEIPLLSPSPPPRIAAEATAVPVHRISQDEVTECAARLFDRRASEIDRLLPAFGNAGIDFRYSCVPLEWYFEAHGWRERNELYVTHALDLIAEATRRCLAEAGCAPEEVDGLVVVSTTGVATPSLDALLIERLALRRDVARLPIFGLGCAGGVLGLAPAAAMAAGGRRVLFIVVELCSITFRRNDSSKSNIIGAALFGDGAAALLLRGDEDGDGPRLGAAGSHTWPDSLEIMGWNVEDDGLGVRFSRDIPALLRNELRGKADRFLAGRNLSTALLAGYVCHPGGSKVIDALEEAFDLPPGGLADARAVLRAYGNMSAATVLFVLQRHMAQGFRGCWLMLALGPGFTAGFQLIEA